MPQELLNEIHGSWFDPSNPVVKMSGSLREDLISELVAWEHQADLVLTLGTSLSGMNSDRLVTTAMKKRAQGKSLGAVIVSLQKTR